MGAPGRNGFFTDTSVCIDRRACGWPARSGNAVPEDGLLMLGSSYDRRGSLGASTWRHVKFHRAAEFCQLQDVGMVGTAAGPAMTDVLTAHGRLGPAGRPHGPSA